MSELSLKGIIDISVQLNSSITYQRGFNTALLLGPYAEVAGMEDADVKYYESLNELVEDFGTSTSVYKAASLYFGQSAVPKGVFVGCLGSSETLANAIIRVRGANSEWYVCIPTDAVMGTQTQATITAAATAVQSLEPASMLAVTLLDSGTYLAIMQALSEAKYTRTISMYDALHGSGKANEGLTAIAAVMGYALGMNSVLSATYTLAYKSFTGITATSDISASALNAILAANGNIYVKQGYFYSLFRQGHVASGDSFDEIIYIDMLVENIKASVMSLLTNSTKIPQTEEGVAVLTASIANVLEQFRAINFIAPGTWNGPRILALEPGDTLANGYLVQFESITSQSPSARSARMAPNCYICVKLAGAIEHITIALVVDK